MPESMPHHSCTTTTPGPEPPGGRTRYPPAVAPLLANSTVSAMCGNLPLRCVCGEGSLRGPAVDDAALTAFGDDMHVALREAARAGPIARQPETGVVLVLGHADVEALGRDSRLVGVGVGNLDAVGITEGP